MFIGFLVYRYHCVLSEHYAQAPPIPGNVRAHIAAAEVNKRPSGGSLTVLEIHHRDAALCSLSGEIQ